MHASFNDLVTLRDEPQRAGAALLAHVRNCARCAQELRLLQQRTEGLRRLPMHVTAPDRWDAIQAALARPLPTGVARARPGWWLAAASAAVVVVAVLVTVQPREESDVVQLAESIENVLPLHATPVSRRPAHLIQESQRLEHLLAEFPDAPRVTRASTALTVADLEDRIQWVDYRLNLVDEAGLGPDQSQLLWRERVDLLQSLVAVRYAQTRAPAF